MTYVAEYTQKTRARPSELVLRYISNGRRHEPLAWFMGLTKTQARKVASENGATPWNF